MIWLRRVVGVLLLGLMLPLSLLVVPSCALLLGLFLALVRVTHENDRQRVSAQAIAWGMVKANKDKAAQAAEEKRARAAIVQAALRDRARRMREQAN